MWQWIKARLGLGLARRFRAVHPHPSLDSDDGARRMEQELMEGETRHVGSRADLAPESVREHTEEADQGG